MTTKELIDTTIPILPALKKLDKTMQTCNCMITISDKQVTGYEFPIIASEITEKVKANDNPAKPGVCILVENIEHDTIAITTDFFNDFVEEQDSEISLLFAETEIFWQLKDKTNYA